MALCVQLDRLLEFVKASASSNETGVVVRPLPAVTALVHRQRGNISLKSTKESSGFPLVLAAVKVSARQHVSCRRVCRHHGLTPGRKFARHQIDQHHKSLEAKDRGVGHEPNLLQRSVDSEMRLSALCCRSTPNLAMSLPSSPGAFPRLREQASFRVCGGALPRNGGSYRSASAAVTQMGAATGWLQRNSLG